MSRPDYQVRVIEEREELQGRMNRLESFIVSAPFHALPEDEQERMRRQFAAMSTYLGVLDERIAAFPAPEAEAPAAEPGAHL